MISIVVPVYNVAKYLPRCIHSVLAQTFTNWEMICVNDGSTDKSLEILEKYASRDKRIRIINKKNAGVSAARNDGVVAARGEYILFLDSDDFIHPQTLEITHDIACRVNADIVSFRHDARLYKQIQNALRNGIRKLPKFAFRHCDVAHVKFKCTRNLLNYATERNHRVGRWIIHHCYPVMHLYRRDLIKNIKFDTDIRITEDFPFWTAVLFARPVAAITNLPLYYYIPNGASALNSVQSMRLFDNVSMAIMRSYDVACRTACPDEMRRWRREFLWPFIITCMRAVNNGGDGIDMTFVASRLREMNATGCFGNPVGMRARKYRRRIMEIIGK